MFPAWTIPKAERDFEVKKTDPIGPGVYNIPEVEVNHEEFPKWTIKGKYPQANKSDMVGPGQYEVDKIDSKGVAYTIQERREAKI